MHDLRESAGNRQFLQPLSYGHQTDLQTEPSKAETAGERLGPLRNGLHQLYKERKSDPAPEGRLKGIAPDTAQP